MIYSAFYYELLFAFMLDNDMNKISLFQMKTANFWQIYIKAKTNKPTDKFQKKIFKSCQYSSRYTHNVNEDTHTLAVTKAVMLSCDCYFFGISSYFCWLLKGGKAKFPVNMDLTYRLLMLCVYAIYLTSLAISCGTKCDTVGPWIESVNAAVSVNELKPSLSICRPPPLP